MKNLVTIKKKKNVSFWKFLNIFTFAFLDLAEDPWDFCRYYVQRIAWTLMNLHRFIVKNA